MAVLKGQEELDQYKLTRREVADFLGITPNAVKCSIRKGNRYKLEYRFDGYQNLFKVPVRDPVISRSVDPLKTPLKRTIQGKYSQSNGTPGGTPKVLNRGATHKGKGNYTSEALKMANEMKILNSINKKFKSEEHRREFEKLNEAGLEEAWKKVQQKKDVDFKKEMAKQDRNNDRNSYGAGFIMGVRYPNKYGTMLNATGIERAEEKKFEKADRQDERKNGVKFVWEYDLNGTYRNTGRPDFTDTNRKPYRNPYGNALFDNWYDKDNSIEIDEYTLRRTPDHLAETNGFGGRTFKNKIEEGIYQAKQKLKNKF